MTCFPRKKFFLPMVLSVLFVLCLLCIPAYAWFTFSNTQQYSLIGETQCSFSDECTESVIEIPLFLNKFDYGFAPYFQIKALAISPQPTRIKSDANGNMRAVFENFHRKGTLTVRQIALVETMDVKFVPSKPYSKDDSFNKFLSPSRFIESTHPKITEKAAQLTKGIKDPWDKARKIYSFVQTHMKYDKNAKYANKGALSALETGRGVCDDHSALMVALLRASGIPSRLVGGYAFNYEMTHVPNGQRFILSDGSRWLEKDNVKTVTGNSRHGWVEFYLQGEGWIPADPTTSEDKDRKYPDWSTFGALNPELDYIPDGIGDTYSTSYKVKGGLPSIEGVVRVIKGYQEIPEYFCMVMSGTGSGIFPLPYFLPYRTVDVIIDGEKKDFSPPAIVKSGSVLVPMRPLFEALGAAVSYDSARKAVEGRWGDNVISLTIGSKKALVNGEPASLATEAQVIAGTVYVLARFVGQTLAKDVSWNGNTRQVIIRTE